MLTGFLALLLESSFAKFGHTTVLSLERIFFAGPARGMSSQSAPPATRLLAVNNPTILEAKPAVALYS